MVFEITFPGMFRFDGAEFGASRGSVVMLDADLSVTVDGVHRGSIQAGDQPGVIAELCDRGIWIR